MILLWVAFGSIIGIIAGLIPGLHSNNFAIMLAVSPFFGFEVTAFMLAMCITQSFVDFIPSIFIGAPSESTFESILPGHKLLLEGRAIEAINYTVFGGVIAVLAGSILTPIFFLFIDENNQQIITLTPFVLAFALLLFVINAKNINKKMWIIFVIIAAATQGMLFKEQIFPLITGYFGIAGTLYSLKEKPLKIKQESFNEINPVSGLDALIGLFGGAIVSILPGIGSNTAAGIINTFRRTKNQTNYLALLGGINISNFFFSYAMLFALGKTRNGAMLAIKDKMFYTPETLFLGTIIMIISSGIGGIATILIAKKASKILNERLTNTLAKASIILMILLVGVFNGTIGIIALLFSTSLGLLVMSKGLQRSSCMSALIVPVLFFYVFILS